ncbi:MAG TPA: regulatory protein RecX, partial [Longimicrobiaceae bacterium]|nr:regulatory protein RecX [Longimicrobiaceae bacterium]
MRITALDPQLSRPDRVNLHLDGAFHAALAADVVYAERLHVGDELDAARLAAVTAADQAWRAREAALLLLSYRPRSAGELRRRLAENGFPAEVAEACVAGLVESGVVDDSAFAELFVRDRVRLRPHGRRRLARELRARGVEPEAARSAIDEVLAREETGDLELARRAAAKWRPRPGEDPRKARRRL